MPSDSRTDTRAVSACEAALADHQYVCAIDVLTGMGLLQPVHVQSWRNGRIDCLESVIQGIPEKIALALATFHQWAQAQGLKKSEVAYVRRTRDGVVDLKFSARGGPDDEKALRVHYLSPQLSERRKEKLSEAPEQVVFAIVRDSKCTECGIGLLKGDFLYLEAGQALCLACAGMNELEYLPRGDTALTRRSTKYSPRTIVVVKFSRTRGRYERQGILLEPAAIERAEQECAADAAERATQRRKGAELRRRQDDELASQMAHEIQELFPGCPAEEAALIAAHTAARGSGRVGRTAAGRRLEGSALTAAVIAAIRHRHTKYDELLAHGADREDARAAVADKVDELLKSWRAPRAARARPGRGG